jgi:hypothetical protein
LVIIVHVQYSLRPFTKLILTLQWGEWMSTEIDELLFRARRCDEQARGCHSAWVATRFRRIASDYRELAAERASKQQATFGGDYLGETLETGEA